MSVFPIIFLHRGNSDYLAISLEQAKYTNPNSRIILLGDNLNSSIGTRVGVEHFLIDNYFNGANDFSKIYEHHSTNNYNYELFCFQRWFIISEFVKSQNIDSFIHIDSDVLLFSNLTENSVFNSFASKYDFMHAGHSPHTCFFNSINSLDLLCNFITSLFRDKSFLFFLWVCPFWSDLLCCI